MSDLSDKDLFLSPTLPVGACESSTEENRKERMSKAEKKKKRRSERKSVRPSVYSTRQDRYLNEELLPSVEKAVNEVVNHRKVTSLEIVALEKEYYRLKLKQLTCGPVETPELDELSANLTAVMEATSSSASRINLENTIKETKQYLAEQKARDTGGSGIREMRAIINILRESRSE